MSISRIDSVNVLRFCHQLTVQGKCHHEGDGVIEQERAEEVGGIVVLKIVLPKEHRE
ncbi:MAG TPA: hypothetical protein G4O17_04710 [Dehalococcoidia bacterium]|nr:hypothetical protein [Dehalococcoidia bacterium]